MKWGKEFTNKAAQKSVKVWDKETALIEIVKYGSKIFTEPDVNKKATQKGQHQIYTAALDNIFRAMQGCRIFEGFGFNLPQSKGMLNENSVTINQYEEWVFQSRCADWLNCDTEQPLTSCIPKNELIELLGNNIDNQKY